MERLEVSQADNLNGVQELWEFTATTAAFRQYYVNSRAWGPWSDPIGQVFDLQIVKRNGTFALVRGSGRLGEGVPNLYNNFGTGLPDYKAMACSQMPQ